MIRINTRKRIDNLIGRSFIRVMLNVTRIDALITAYEYLLDTLHVNARMLRVNARK